MKYEFTGETKYEVGITLRRIRALAAIAQHGVSQGDLGGWIESESNLSQTGPAWVSGNAQVSGDAWVYGDAQVYGNAQVSGDAWVYGDAQVSGAARVSGDAQVYGDAWVSGDAWVYGAAQVSGAARIYGAAQVSGDARVSSPMLCASRSDGYLFVCAERKGNSPVIMVGCRYFTFDKAKVHWSKTRKGTPLGDETFAIIAFFEAAAKARGWKL